VRQQKMHKKSLCAKDLNRIHPSFSSVQYAWRTNVWWIWLKIDVLAKVAESALKPVPGHLASVLPIMWKADSCWLQSASIADEKVVGCGGSASAD